MCFDAQDTGYHLKAVVHAMSHFLQHQLLLLGEICPSTLRHALFSNINKKK